jgi:hypothetical protein
MIPQVHEFALLGSASPLIDLYAPLAALRSPRLCAIAGLVGAAVLFAAVRAEARGRVSQVIARALLLPPSLMLFAMYALTWGSVDEVSINLEHTRNLFQFGRFSFSPERMLDGTVEYAYYLLLTPFGGSAATLMIANFGLGFLIAWGHLWLLARLLRQEPVPVRLGILLLFTVNYTLVAMLSNGFGNSLISLACLGSLALQFAGRQTWAAVLASAMPLLRPDAVLYSYALLFAFSAADRTRWSRSTLVRWLWPACALAGYLCLFRVVYGHWVPTPIAFKSVYPSMISLAAIRDLIHRIPTELSAPLQILALLACAALSAARNDPRVAVMRRLLLPMAAIYGFYSLTRSTIGDYSGDVYARYWIGFELTLFLCLSWMLLHVSRLPEARTWQLAIFGRLVPTAVLFLAVNAIAWDTGRQRYPNRSNLGYASQIAETIVPPGLSIASSEMSTFSLMIDREVVDLWGYTNPAIAHSRILNGARVRSNPAFFMAARPHVYFAYPEPLALTDTERYLATFHQLLKSVNLLGDMNTVLETYDVVIVRHPQRSVLFLVRRDAVVALRQSLIEHAYAAINQRAFDLPAFRALYDRQVFEQVRF